MDCYLGKVQSHYCRTVARSASNQCALRTVSPQYSSVYLLCVLQIKKRDPRANIVVTPSDHVVLDASTFRSVVENAMEFSAETDAIVTLGIHPTRPETGYGYIKADLTFSSSRKKDIFRVDSFKEKPNLELAQEYVTHDNYLWNSGIFIWSVSTIINAFRVYEPDMSKAFERLTPIYDTEEEQERINELYPSLENISVDYAILEKAEEIFVCPASFGWSDLGTWTSLRDNSQKDRYGNAGIGPDINFYDSFNCVVHAEKLKKVVVQGLDGYVVAERDGTLLICKLSEEQRIKLFHD